MKQLHIILSLMTLSLLPSLLTAWNESCNYCDKIIEKKEKRIYSDEMVERKTAEVSMCQNFRSLQSDVNLHPSTLQCFHKSLKEALRKYKAEPSRWHFNKGNFPWLMVFTVAITLFSLKQVLRRQALRGAR